MPDATGQARGMTVHRGGRSRRTKHRRDGGGRRAISERLELDRAMTHERFDKFALTEANASSLDTLKDTTGQQDRPANWKGINKGVSVASTPRTSGQGRQQWQPP